jgi:hypothetical protein
MFQSYDQKLVFFVFYGHFHELFPQFWGSKMIYMFEKYQQKQVIFAFYGRFHEFLPMVLGF